MAPVELLPRQGEKQPPSCLRKDPEGPFYAVDAVD